MMTLPPQLIATAKQLVPLPSGGTATLPVCQPVFLKWNGKPPAFDFGKKPIVDDGGKPVFAELALLNLLRASGWEGVWVQTFGGTHFLRDMPAEWKHAAHHVAIPKEKEELLWTIWKTAGTTACFDVFAWKDTDILFCEAKRERKDRLTHAQHKFIKGALQCGVPSDSLLFARWRFKQIRFEKEQKKSVIFTPKTKKAIRFATKTHEVYQKQKRKGKDIPYITHPLAVGLILARANASEDVVIAGILHDTIEDSTEKKKVTREMLAQRFGNNVADLVASVTEEHKDAPWEERKREAREHIKHYSHDSLLVKSADLICNVSDILDDYADHGSMIFSRFNAPKEKLIENYKETIKTVLDRWPENPFADDLNALITELNQIERTPQSQQ